MNSTIKPLRRRNFPTSCAQALPHGGGATGFGDAPSASFKAVLTLAVVILICSLGPRSLQAQEPKLAPLTIKSASASSQLDHYTPAKAIDGKISNESRWVSKPSAAAAWIEFQLEKPVQMAGVHLHMGYNDSSTIESFRLQFFRDQRWQDIPSAVIQNNKATALAIAFDDTVEVVSDRLRLWIDAPKDGSQPSARVKECVIWPAGAGDLPQLRTEKTASTAQTGGNDPRIPLIYLNQTGFNLNRPKRFTAPTLPDGTAFEVQPAQGGAAAFRGVIRDHIGDLSAFNPTSESEYVVVAQQLRSVPFRIAPWLLERVTYQNMVNFMIDSRHYVGNDRTPCPGSFGWRDDHHFGWELHSLVTQYMANPGAYERMPKQIRYEKPTKQKAWGRLHPYREEACDLVKLIHWGADVIVTQGLEHELLKAQLAYFLYAWPMLKDDLPEQNYQVVRDYAFAIWDQSKADHKYPYDESSDHNLLALKTVIGSTKGSLPPGFSIEPNLLMHEVAKRERRSDAQRYLDAAVKQAAWMVAHLDWNDPLTTKGQRMSEFVTMTGLAHLLRVYPQQAPAGLREKINAWAAVVLRRSANMWDFRKLDDGENWTPMGPKPTMWNEPGNVIGLPAALIAAQPFLDDQATRDRFDQLIYAQFDCMFGRNPVGRHFSYDAPREIPGVEFGWFRFYNGGIGRLADARFVIDGSPKNAHFPYHPEQGDIGWTEGWIQFNTPFNISMSYLAFTQTQIEAQVKNQQLHVRLIAPLNFDPTAIESARVLITLPSGDQEWLRVNESSANSGELIGKMDLVFAKQVKAGNGRIEANQDDMIKVQYGFGHLQHSAQIKPN